jgi:hypothetical protein
MIKNVKPLEEVNFSVIQQPLFGLLRNVEGDLRKRLDQVTLTNDADEIRRTLLLLSMLKFAINSYQAVSFLLSDVDEHPRRRPEFVFVVPPINRQLMDLWFSMVYIMDDLAPRALAYEQCGYREMTETVARAKSRYGSDSEWKSWFDDMQDLIKMMERQIPLSPAEIADPYKIDYWLAPFKLAKQPTKSQPFLKLLEELIYHDTSNEAHLKPGGLLISTTFLLKELAPDDVKRQIEERNIHQYKFRHYCRTVVAILGIASEIELFGKFGNHEHAAKVWSLLAGYNADARDVYQMRYQELLSAGTFGK